jgi:hypothetical protein
MRARAYRKEHLDEHPFEIVRDFCSAQKNSRLKRQPRLVLGFLEIEQKAISHEIEEHSIFALQKHLWSFAYTDICIHLCSSMLKGSQKFSTQNFYFATMQ